MVVDTSIIIDHIRKKDKATTRLFQLADESELYLSAVSMYELYKGRQLKLL
jgi:predicted nucleic acid-binding protein